MLDLDNLTNQSACLQVGFFYIKIPALSVNEFYSIAPSTLPELDLLFNVIIIKDNLSFVKLKYAVDPASQWCKSALFIALKKQYKLFNWLTTLLVNILFKVYSDCFIFQLLAKQNGLISYFDLAYLNKNSENKKELGEKEIIENYCLNFSLIKQLFGNQINNQIIELTNIHDILTYTQFHFFLNSDLLMKGLAQCNAQISLDPEKHTEREISYIETQFKHFKNLMRGCFGDLPESRYFDTDIEARFKRGMGKRNIQLYDLIKGIFKL